MKKGNLREIAQYWLIAKQEEAAAIANRRILEDAMSEMLEINAANEGTFNFEDNEYKVKIMTRMTRKVDADKLQEIAAEHDLNKELSTLFRWKADLDMKNWKSAPIEVVNVLSQAVTTTAGRPSYSITKEEI
jgi:hypothetical protein